MPVTVQSKLRAQKALPNLAMRRAIRVGAGLSQADVAECLGVHRESVSRWESGHRTPRGRVLVDYVALLDELRALHP
jgi:DNA-binding transcriptional regulator YiaG